MFGLLHQAIAADAKMMLACDRKPVSHRIVPKTGACMFRLSRDHVAGRGSCVTHGGITCHIPPGSDLLSAGLPCHPFSTMRVKTGTGPRSSSAETHEEYGVVMHDFVNALRTRRPGGLFINTIAHTEP